jgi:hypothetical protein
MYGFISIDSNCQGYKSKPFMLTKHVTQVFYVLDTTNKRLKVRESNEDSNEGGKESNTLTKALRTKEQQGRVLGISSKLTWKEGFSAHKSTYQKQKMTSTPMVDMEQLKRKLRRELLGDLKPTLESQGIQFPDITGMMSEEERRSSLASIVATPMNTEPTDQVPESGQPQGLEVAKSRPVGVREPPLPSLELDTIDKLAHPTACNLVVLVGGGY